MMDLKHEEVEKAKAPGGEQFTQLLQDWHGGNDQAYQRLFELAYPEIKKIAHYKLQRERANHTLQTTALAHEVFSKLIGASGIAWENRRHFYAVVAKAIFQILIDYAKTRRRKAHAFQNEDDAIPLDAHAEGYRADLNYLLDLQKGLERLERVDSQLALIAMLKLTFGMKPEEIAKNLDMEKGRVYERWKMCKALLKKFLDPKKQT